MSAVLEPIGDVEVIDRAEINNGKVLVSYSRTEAALADLAAKYKGAKYDLTTVAGDKAARAARLDLVTLRTSLEKRRKELKAPALEFGKLIDSEAKRLTDSILALEAPIDQQIRDDEARREQIRAEKAAAEAARQQRHRDGIAKIRSYADAARLPGMTAERLLKGLSALEGMTIDPAAWEEFATEAAHVLAETTAAVKAEHAALVEREAEAARLEFQRQEQARIAAEQAEAQRKLDEQAAALRAQQEAQAAAIAAQQAEIARQAEALAEQQRAAEAAEAQRQAALLAEQQKQNFEAQDSQQVLKAEPAMADATARETPVIASPVGGPTGVGQAAAAAPAGGDVEPMDQPWAMPASIPVGEVVESVEPAAAPVLADDGSRWKLGEIAALFGVGLTAETVRSLGIEPVATDKRALLFTTLQVIELRTALVAHLMGVEIE